MQGYWTLGTTLMFHLIEGHANRDYPGVLLRPFLIDSL